MSKHARRVSITFNIRNGDGNFLETWSGHWFDAGIGELSDIEKAGMRSFLDALERRSPVLPRAKDSYPHHD
jgi:hypothetical protein